MSIPATAFTLFNILPKELRIHIWMSALPGPRIIYVQRFLTSGDYPDISWQRGDDGVTPAEPSYFMSGSPDGLFIPLLLTCKDSHSVVTREYEIIFPASSTWFSFSTDFLYIDWGGYCYDPCLSYSPGHFTASYVRHNEIGIWESPEISEDVAKKVKNVVLHKERIGGRRPEPEIVKDLEVFSGMKILVLADRLHHMDDTGKELVWLRGKLGDESRWLSELQAKETVKEKGEANDEPETEREYREWLVKLLLWLDNGQYRKCNSVSSERFKDEWEKRYGLTDGREMPTIFRKSITTREVKNNLLEICGSEDDFQKLEGLDMEFVENKHEYSGPLDISQQIAFLELVLDRTLAEYRLDSHGHAAESENVFDISKILSKIDALRREKEIKEQAMGEAKEIVRE